MSTLEKLNAKEHIIHWLKEEPYHWQALQVASKLNLKDWCLAAGFVRNLVWDKLHNYTSISPLNDIDLIYFDDQNTDESFDKQHEVQLKQWSSHPWSVKNQAMMHHRNFDAPYTSTLDAMSYWVEEETAIGVRIMGNGDLELLAPFGLSGLMDLTITMNKKRPKRDVFLKRVSEKNWLKRWAKLKVIT